MNKITIIGNVVHTPQMRATNSGVSVCNFSVAVRRRFKNPQTGEYDTDFFEVQAWRQLAELCEKFLEKGKKVAVVGSMQSREYEKDGIKKRIWELLADEVEFITPKSESAPAAKANYPTRENAREIVKRSMMEAQATAQTFTEIDDDEPLPF